MSLYTAALNSGSNANCYYVGNAHEAVLIDAGLSCRETEKRMTKLGLSIGKVRALFVSHEHSDHISGVPGIARKYGLPVYITADTLYHGNIPLEPGQVRPFRHNKPVSIGELEVLPFRKSHDAADPHSFLVSSSGISIGIFTDIGHACKQVTRYFARCQAAFLESNYCDTMLENGNYPYPLKQRIRSNEGHLSNDQALELFLQHRSPGLQLLILAHLSKNNNKPELVKKLFAPHAGHTRIIVASRYEATPLFELPFAGSAIRTPQTGSKTRGKKQKNERQLSLF